MNMYRVGNCLIILFPRGVCHPTRHVTSFIKLYLVLNTVIFKRLCIEIWNQKIYYWMPTKTLNWPILVYPTWCEMVNFYGHHVDHQIMPPPKSLVDTCTLDQKWMCGLAELFYMHYFVGHYPLMMNQYRTCLKRLKVVCIAYQHICRN